MKSSWKSYNFTIFVGSNWKYYDSSWGTDYKKCGGVTHHRKENNYIRGFRKILEPLLFSIFINDLPSILDIVSKFCLYADDTALVTKCTSTQNLESFGEKNP